MAEAASMSTCCGAGKPLSSTYEPKGSFQRLDDFDTYISHKADGNKGAVILIYDVFGFAKRGEGNQVEFPQVLQVADRLAEAGLTVAVPDVFKGKPWTMDKMPPKPEHDFQGWLASAASWEAVQPAVKTTIAHLKSELKAQKVGIVGFCWGGSIAIRAAESLVDAAGAVHASFFGRDAEYAAKVAVPFILLPAKGDPLETVKEVLDTKEFGSQCVYKRFDDQEHGFCAARGDWSKPEVAAGAAEAVGLVTDFVTKQLL